MLSWLVNLLLTVLHFLIESKQVNLQRYLCTHLHSHEICYMLLLRYFPSYPESARIPGTLLISSLYLIYFLFIVLVCFESTERGFLLSEWSFVLSIALLMTDCLLTNIAKLLRTKFVKMETMMILVGMDNIHHLQ